MYEQNKLELTDSNIYLETNLNYNGLFNKATTKNVNQARHAMFNYTIKTRKLDIQCELSDQLVMPILLYGSEIWGFQNLDQIERFHKKSILKLNRSTASCNVYGEVCRKSVATVIEKRMINVWIHLIEGKQSKLSNIIQAYEKYSGHR